MQEIELYLLFVLTGLLFGSLLMWFIAKLRFAAFYISKKELEANYTSLPRFLDLQQRYERIIEECKTKDNIRVELEKNISALERDLQHLSQRMAYWNEEAEKLRQKSHVEFEVIANKLLQEKSERFTAQNEKQINDLLQPLHNKIREFGQDIKSHFSEEAKDVVSLKKEIEGLREMNAKISTDAQNLALALKGDSKIQGDWGEFQLELILEKAGLSKDIHYRAQASFKDQNGHDKRPDFIINLPEGRQLIIDSKVSLRAYEKYYNAADDAKKESYLKEHLESLKSHVKELSSKNYTQLYQINSPDFVLLFVPIEPALWGALHLDNKLYFEALGKNIILVTTSTLLASLRIVTFTWQQDRQTKNVKEIARQSGMLYDKFVAFIEDLREIGLRLQKAQDSFNEAMNKLTDSRKYGDTLIGRAEKIRELGAKTTKVVPKELLPMTSDGKNVSNI
jgi:DNA recombination protein RmuC